MAQAGHQHTALDLTPADLPVPFCSPWLTLQSQLPAASWVCSQKRRHFSCSLLVSFALFTTPSPCCGTAAHQRTAQLLSGSFLLRALFGGCILHLLFFAIHKEEREVTNPQADVRAGLTSPGEGAMLPAPVTSLEVGKTGVRRALLHGAGFAHPFLSLPGPGRQLLHCPAAPSHCSIPPLHPAAPSHCSVPPGPATTPVTSAVASGRSRRWQ